MRSLYAALLTTCAVLLSAVGADAQTITIGAGSASGTSANGAATDSGPMYKSSAASNFAYSRYHYLYTQAELAAAGIPTGSVITQVTWYKDNVATTIPPASFEIYMKNSSLTAVQTPPQTYAALTTGSTLVYSTTSLVVPNAAGPVSFPLSATLTYTGGALEITTSVELTGGTTAGFSWKRDPINNRTLAYVNSTPSTTLNVLRTVRPQITLAYTAGSACVSPPTAGTTTASPATAICSGTTVNLGLTGNSGGSGQTYQLESASALGGPYTPIGTAGGTTAFSVTPSTTIFYRVAVTCGTSTAYSTPVQVIVNPAFPGGTYTINSAVATGGTNFQTISAAASAINCGISGPVVFNVASGSGPYNEQVTIGAVGGSSSTNTVTFNGNGNVLTYASANTNERAGFKLDGADFVTINNFNVQPTGTYGFGIQLLNDADNNTITGCTINADVTTTSSNYAGIVVSGTAISATATGSNCDNNLISGNTVNGGYYGITALGASGAPITNNIIENNTVSDFYFYGIYLSYFSTGQVRGNNISRPAKTNPSSFYGIYLANPSPGNNITRNRLHDPFGGIPANTGATYAIYLSSADGGSGTENVISNNLIYNIVSGGLIYALYNIGSPYARYYHNTISLDDAGSTAAGVTRGFYQTTAAVGIEFRNNIISVTRGGAGIKHALYFGTATSTITSNNNDLYVAAAAGSNYIGYLASGTNGPDYATLTDWQTNTGKDAASVSVNPLFSTGFVPGAAAVDNLGTPVGVTVDINSAPRSATTPDIGAVEFTVPLCTSPPTPGTTLASPGTTVCSGASVSLSLSGNSSGAGQTYQLQSAGAVGGPYTSIGAAGTTTTFSVMPATTAFYRVAVTCSGFTTYSTPVQVTVNPGLAGGVYTINSAMATGGSNYQTIGAAASALNCGITGPVVFNVVPGSGPYNEQVTIGAISGASASNTVTFNGNGALLTYASANTAERAGFKLDGADYVTISTFTIFPTGTYGYGVQLLNDADHNTILANTIQADSNTTSSNYAGIVISGSASSATTTGSNCDSNVISANVINGGYYGITALGSSATAINNNNIESNTIRNFYYYGIYLSYFSTGQVHDNNISRPTKTNPSLFYGIYLTSGGGGNDITRNILSDPFGGATTSTSAAYPIYITSADANSGAENVVSNNLIYNMVSAGIIYALYSTGSDNVRYYHNTISLDDASATTTSVTRGFYQATLATGVEFRNNIISITRGGAGIKYALYFGTATSGITSNNNDLYVTPAAGNYIGYLASGTNGPDYATLADWQTNTGKDAASLSTDPLFTAPGTGNFTPGAAAIDNLGAPVGVAIDITGTSRSATTPDVGAIEFYVPLCMVPPTAGTTTANVAAVCSGTTVQFNLNGNSTGAGQSYQLQVSPTLAGPYTNTGSSGTSPTLADAVMATGYYQVAVTCSGNTSYSTPVLVTVKSPMTGGTYTINSAAATGGNNFQTFADAMSAMECGITGPVVLNVATGSGPYVEQVIFPANLTGTSAANTIIVNGNGATISYNSSNTTQRAGIKLNNVDYVTIRNLIIQPTGTYGFGIQLLNNSDNVTIKGCTINLDMASTLTNYAGIVVSGSESAATTAGSNCDNLVIDSNTVNGGYYGITLIGTTTTLTNNNVVTRNILRDYYIYGVYASYNNGALIEANDMSRPTRSVISTFYGVFLTTGNIASLVSRNRIHNPCGGSLANASQLSAVYIAADGTAAAPNVIANNLIYDFNGQGIIYALYDATGAYAQFYHNTVSLDYAASTATAVTRGFYQTGATSGIDLKNNIFTISRGGTGAKHALYFNTATTTFTSDYNDFYITATGGTVNNVAYINATQYPTLASVQTGTTYEANSLAVNPAYASPGTGNFTPTAAALDNEGTPVGILTDIVNAPRNTTTPDIGAYEFTAAQLVNDNAPGAILLTPGAGCTGTAYTNAGATQSAGETVPYCNGSTTGYHTVWFKFVAPASGAVRVSTDAGSGPTIGNSRIAVFSTTNVASYATFSILGCDDDNGSAVGNLLSVVYLTGLTGGTTYYIEVDGYSNADAGTFCLTVDPLSNSMLATTAACTGGQSNSAVNGYTGITSLVDNSSKLIANVSIPTGNSGNSFTPSQNINTTAVRSAIFNSVSQNYLDRSYTITSTATNATVQFFFLNSELSTLQAADPATTLANINVTEQTGATCAPSFVAAGGTNTTLFQNGNGTSSGVSWITALVPGFSNFYLHRSSALVSAVAGLQGAMQTGGTMTNNLQNFNGTMLPGDLLPSTDPYGLGATYTAINNTTGIAGAVTDWVRLEVRNATSTATLSTPVQSRAILLKTDGTMVDPATGTAPVFEAHPYPVRLVLIHRNHLAVMSNNISSFIDATAYNFTTSLSQASVQAGDPVQMVLVGGKWCLWSGDVISDYFIEGLDFSTVSADNDANLPEGYRASDLNLDGFTDGLDVSVISVNNDFNLYSTLVNY